MDGLVEAVFNATSKHCHTYDCNKDGCSISVKTAVPKNNRVIIDLDRAELQIPRDRKRCDYVFIGEKNRKTWIVPIELKSGRFDPAEVVDQLQAGADKAKTWLPPKVHFLFIPVLAHGKSPVSPRQYTKLRSRTVRMGGQMKKVETMSCGGRLKDVLDKSA